MQPTTPTIATAAPPLSIEAFASYAWKNRNDQADVTLLVQEMRLRGMRVFRDKDHVSEGVSIEDLVADAIVTTHVYVPYLTPESLKSQPVRRMEFAPAHKRQAAGEMRTVVLARRLGTTREQVADRVWKELAFDLGASWTGLYPGKGKLTADQATRAANEVLKTALRVVDTEAPVRLTVSTHGDRMRAKGLHVDATEILGGDVRRPGTPDEWARVLRGLRDVSAALLGAREAGPLEVVLRSHLSAAIATGWAFRATTGWNITVAQGDPRMSAAQAGRCDELTVTVENGTFTEGGTLMVQIGLARDIEDTVTATLAKGARPRRRLRFAHTFAEGEFIPSAVMGDMGLKLARTIKQHVDETAATAVHIYIAAPAAIALHMGAHLGAMPATTVFEFNDTDHTYVPTLELPAS